MAGGSVLVPPAPTTPVASREAPGARARAGLWIAAAMVAALACRRDASSNSAERVVTLGPVFTEIAFALGRGDRVVGVSDYCDYPREARDRTRVGGFINPNIERILALRPDLVVIVGDFPAGSARLRDAGVRTLLLPAESLDDVYRAVDRLGEALDARSQAQRLGGLIRRDLEAVRRRAEGHVRPRVLYVLDRMPGRVQGVVAAGGRSFLTDLIDVAGGANALGQEDRGAIPLSTERLIALAPEVILDASHDPAGVAAWGALRPTPAVRDGRLVPVRDPIFTIPGPRIAKAAERMLPWLHPEIPIRSRVVEEADR